MKKLVLGVMVLFLLTSVMAHAGEPHNDTQDSQTGSEENDFLKLTSGYPDWMAKAVASASFMILSLTAYSVVHYRRIS
ncbi:MAG: hypothetical protein BRC26_02520 [Nanohaloarchaea archaeon QH_8_44_6]|nr:MAG: hypothetical protein BRC26_02520 [Nanohaloarchaea archaeon QH_8_44_6]